MLFSDIAHHRSGGAGAVRWFALAVILVAIWGLGSPTWAGDQSRPAEGDELEDCEKCYRIDVIVLEGLLRTEPEVVERELLVEEGEVATIDEIEESVQRLRNTGLFRRVDYELVDQTIGAWDEAGDDQPGAGRLFRIVFDERYTLSPSFRLSGGGDTLALTLGLEDTNIAGKFYQGGVSYRRLGGTNSFGLWFRDPRLLDRRQSVTFSAEIDNRVYSLFEADGQIEGGYQRYRRGIGLDVEREWRRWFRTGAGLSLAENRFGYDLVDQRRREAQRERGGLYETDRVVGYGLRTRFGRINTHGHRRSGTSLQLRADQFHHSADVRSPSRQARVRLLDFRDLPMDGVLATRAEVGVRDAEPTYMHFFGGGLGTLRGTWDQRHRGPHHWLANLEVRVPTFRTSWLIVQNVAFVDTVRVADGVAGLGGVTAATTGLGVRLISRDFPGLLFRLDYAPPIGGADGPGLSFGAGHFF